MAQATQSQKESSFNKFSVPTKESHKPIEQTMEVLPKGTRRLAAQLRTSASVQSLWKTLTQYDQLSEFIPNLIASNVLDQSNNAVILKQVGSQDFLGLTFRAEVVLRLLEEKSFNRISFSLLKGDFRRFDGSWVINEIDSSKEVSLIYELTVQGCFGMPVALIEQRLRQDLTTNLLAVEKQALKNKP